jgi:DNA-binding transcriptional MerR regulator
MSNDDNKVKQYSIGEVSSILGVKESTLRYWEKEFDILNPDRTDSNRRVYTDKDINLIKKIIYLLNDMKYTIAGAKEEINKNRIDSNTNKKSKQTKKAYKKNEYNNIKNELKDILNLLDDNKKD